MPSNHLSLICKQIESQDTDHFGKFYMYVSLLSTVSARNKNFTENLPQYSKGLFFWRDNTLNLGDIPTEFNQRVTQYAREFATSQPDLATALFNLALAYIRQGKITDLTYIIDQMLNHLTAIYGNQSHNNKIYNYINFKDKMGGLSQFIMQISEFNQQLLSLVDNGCNTVLSIAAITSGLVLILASVFSLIPSIIGLGLIIGGVYGAYSFVTQAIEQSEQLEKKIKQSFTELPRDESIFGNENHHAFFTSVVMPLPYAVITALDHVCIDEPTQKKLSEERAKWDAICDLVGTIKY